MKSIDMLICDATRNRTYVELAKSGKARKVEFDLTFISISTFTNNLNRIVQESVYFAVYKELDDMQ